MRLHHASPDASVTGICVLVADDDERVRTLHAMLIRAVHGVSCVIEAEDGAEAVELSRSRDVDVAVLDLNMPRLDGVAGALRLRALAPALRIALHSSDPELLRARASGLGLPLFDKADVDPLLAWIEREANDAHASAPVAGQVAPISRKVDLCCARCGYGVVCRKPPARCPMCGGEADWIEPPGWNARRAAFHERLAG